MALTLPPDDAAEFDREPNHDATAALVERARSGDARALDSLWRGHRRWVAAIVLGHAPRQVELEDLLQEVAVAVVAKIADLRDPRRFRGWLRTIALNVARGAGRRVALRARFEPTESNVDPESVVDPAPADEDARVLTAIAELAVEYREPLVLRCVNGLSQREIAHELDLPETTVETRLARARRQLREKLERGNVFNDTREGRVGYRDDP